MVVDSYAEKITVANIPVYARTPMPYARARGPKSPLARLWGRKSPLAGVSGLTCGPHARERKCATVIYATRISHSKQMRCSNMSRTHIPQQADAL